MNIIRHLLLVSLLLSVSCAPKGPPPVYRLTNVIPAGHRIDYFAEIHNGKWQRTLTQRSIPRPMHIKEAKKWAISAAQQRLGNHWRDFYFRVTPPSKSGEPIVIWQREVQRY
jgi:hypothetical protein